jgi:hypothetical protein
MNLKKFTRVLAIVSLILGILSEAWGIIAESSELFGIDNSVIAIGFVIIAFLSFIYEKLTTTNVGVASLILTIVTEGWQQLADNPDLFGVNARTLAIGFAVISIVSLIVNRTKAFLKKKN